MRDIVLDTRALSALLDERKPDHADASRAMEHRLRTSAEADGVAGAPVFVVPALVVYEVRRGLLIPDRPNRLDLP